MSIGLGIGLREDYTGRLSPEAELDQSWLVSRAQSGDSQAFDALMEVHLHCIYLTAKKITRNHEDAEDACQESMVKAFVNIQRFQGNAKFSTWLTRIVINEALMTVRRMQVEARYRSSEGDASEIRSIVGLRDPKATSDPETLCAQAEQTAMLWEAINELDAKSRSAVCVLGIEEKETWETVETFRLSRSGMRSRLQRGLRKLRSTITEKLGTNMPLQMVDERSRF